MHALGHAAHDSAVLTMSHTDAGSCNRCSGSVMFALYGEPRKLEQAIMYMACVWEVWRYAGTSVACIREFWQLCGLYSRVLATLWLVFQRSGATPATLWLVFERSGATPATLWLVFESSGYSVACIPEVWRYTS